jgi:hypothetical protein
VGARIAREVRNVLPKRAPVAVCDALSPYFTSRPVVRAFHDLPGKGHEDLDLVVFTLFLNPMLDEKAGTTVLGKIVADPDWEVPWVYGDVIIFARRGKLPYASRLALGGVSLGYRDTRAGHQLVLWLALQARKTGLAKREAAALQRLGVRFDQK